MGLKFHTHGTELYCEYVDPSICYGGGESSGSSQSQGYGSSYQQSASLSLPVEMNPTTANLGNTESQLQAIQKMLGGGASSNTLLQSYLAPYGGNMSAPVTAAQTATLNNLGAAEGGNFSSFNPTLQAVYDQLVGEATNPAGFAENVASAGTGGTSAASAGQILAQALGLGLNPVQAGQTLAGGAFGGAGNAAAAGQLVAGGAFNGAGSAADAGTYLASQLFGGAPNATAAGTGAASALFGGAPNAQAAGQALAASAFGGAPNATAASQDYASGLAGPGSPPVSEGQFAANLATNPFTQSVIQEAEQPITTAFNTQTVPGLAGSFASAGQRPTGGGSSAFGAAFGNAQAQEEANLGSVASGIANSTYQTGLGQYATAYNNAGNTYANLVNAGATEYGGAFNNALDQFASTYGLGAGQYAGLYGQGVTGYENLYGQGANTFANTFNTGAANYTNLFGGGLNVAAGAPGNISSLTGNEVNQLIATLNAQALPQLTEQQGINNALSTYNGSVASILQSLGLQIQGEQPAIGYESETASNSASFQNEESSGQNQSFSFQI